MRSSFLRVTVLALSALGLASSSFAGKPATQPCPAPHAGKSPVPPGLKDSCTSVPEVDASSSATALTLVAGVMLWVGSRRRGTSAV